MILWSWLLWSLCYHHNYNHGAWSWFNIARWVHSISFLKDLVKNNILSGKIRFSRCQNEISNKPLSSDVISNKNQVYLIPLGERNDRRPEIYFWLWIRIVFRYEENRWGSIRKIFYYFLLFSLYSSIFFSFIFGSFWPHLAIFLARQTKIPKSWSQL